MELPWLSRWQPQLLALLRIMAALLFMEHGTAKLLHFPVPQPGVPDPLPSFPPSGNLPRRATLGQVRR